MNPNDPQYPDDLKDTLVFRVRHVDRNSIEEVHVLNPHHRELAIAYALDLKRDETDHAQVLGRVIKLRDKLMRNGIKTRQVNRAESRLDSADGGRTGYTTCVECGRIDYVDDSYPPKVDDHKAWHTLSKEHSVFGCLWISSRAWRLGVVTLADMAKLDELAVRNKRVAKLLHDVGYLTSQASYAMGALALILRSEYERDLPLADHEEG